MTVRVRRKDQTFVWLEVDGKPVKNASTGRPEKIVLTMRDVTERKTLQERLEALAFMDGLTGLMNRRGFDATLERTWAGAMANESQMSLLLLDIDHFKRFNDSFGHHVGDDCLRAVAKAVTDSVAPVTAHVARYGGEEIAVVLPDCDSKTALQTAEIIRLAVQALQVPSTTQAGSEAVLSVSIGVATALVRPGGCQRMPESLVLTADTALYKAKRNGRNRLALMLLMASR